MAKASGLAPADIYRLEPANGVLRAGELVRLFKRIGKRKVRNRLIHITKLTQARR